MTLDIMMPFYGRVDHFKSAVNSVLEQTDPDWRLIIVDDVYPDRSAGDWAQSIGDRRLTYIRNEENLRPSRNYVKCVGLMEAEFAILMGCDDVMLPGYVERVKELIAEYPNASVIQPGVSIIDADGNAAHPLADRMKRIYRFGGSGARSFHGEPLAISLLRGNWTYFPSLCWRVSDLRRYNFRVDLDVVQDLAMLLDIVMGGGHLVLDDRVVFHYRRHSTSVSARTGPDGSRFVQERTFFADTERDARRLNWKKAARAARVHLSSRFNAITNVPAALRAPKSGDGLTLVRHAFGGSGSPSGRQRSKPGSPPVS